MESATASTSTAAATTKGDRVGYGENAAPQSSREYKKVQDVPPEVWQHILTWVIPYGLVGKWNLDHPSDPIYVTPAPLNYDLELHERSFFPAHVDYGILSGRLDPAKWDVRTFAYYWYPPTMDHFRFLYEQNVWLMYYRSAKWWNTPLEENRYFWEEFCWTCSSCDEWLVNQVQEFDLSIWYPVPSKQEQAHEERSTFLLENSMVSLNTEEALMNEPAVPNETGKKAPKGFLKLPHDVVGYMLGFLLNVQVAGTRNYDEPMPHPETIDEWNQRTSEELCWPKHMQFLVLTGRVDPRCMSFNAFLFYWSPPTQEDMHMIWLQNRRLELKMRKKWFQDPAVPLWETQLREYVKNGPVYTMHSKGIPHWEWRTPRVLEGKCPTGGRYGEYVTTFQNWRFVKRPWGNGRG
jgi:hypothetical protein